jgi:excisionase family DNA binding protein
MSESKEPVYIETTEEAAKRLMLCTETLRRWARKGKIKA